MNITEVVNRLKYKLGLVNIATPFKDLDSIMVDIIQTITLPVFSVYLPNKESITLNTNALTVKEKTANWTKFLMPVIPNKKLLYVIEIRYDDTCLAGMGYYGGGLPLMSGNLLNQSMLANAGAQVMSTLMPKITFKFEQPRTITVYNEFSYSTLIFDCGFEHDKSLASIPDTARDSFIKLAELDVKANLYPTLRQYTELNTAVGTINLKLDDWQDAESRRNELIEQMDDRIQLDMTPMFYF